MENDDLSHTRALIVEIKAEKGARGWSNETLAKESGIPLGTINRMLSKNPREIFIRQIADLARAFDMTASELVQNAEKRFERMSSRAVSEGADNVTPLHPRDRTVDQLEGDKREAADRHDPEATEPETE